MAIAKIKSKNIKQDMAQAHVCTCQPSPIHKHLFLGGAITLLLVLGTAQFALSSHIYDSTRANARAFAQTMDGIVKKDTAIVSNEDFYMSLPSGWQIMESAGVYRIIAAKGDFGTIYIHRDGVESKESQRNADAGYMKQFVQRVKMKEGYGPDIIIEYLTSTDPSKNVYATLQHFVEQNIDFYQAVGGPTVTEWTQAHEGERAYPTDVVN